MVKEIIKNLLKILWKNVDGEQLQKKHPCKLIYIEANGKIIILLKIYKKIIIKIYKNLW